MSLILLPKDPHPSRRALSSLLPQARLFWPSLPALPTAMIPPRNFLPAPSPHAPPIPRQEPIHPSKYYTFMPESSCVSLSGLSPPEPSLIPSSTSMFQTLTSERILHTSPDSCVLDFIPPKLYPASRHKENYTSCVLSQPSQPISERPNEKCSHTQVALQKYKTYKNARDCWPSPRH